MDPVSGLVFAKPTKYANRHSTIEALGQLIHQYGPPHQIESDQGTHFSGHNVQDWAQGLGIDWIFHIAYHPQANGLIERMNGMLTEQLRKLTSTKALQPWSSPLTKVVFLLNSRNIHNQTPYDHITTPPVQNMVRIEILPDGISPKIVTTGQMELFTPTDCMVGPRPVSLDVKIHIITPENAVWFCTPTSPLILHPLLISNSRVLVFQVSLTNTCALSRGDKRALERCYWCRESNMELKFNLKKRKP